MYIYGNEYIDYNSLFLCRYCEQSHTCGQATAGTTLNSPSYSHNAVLILVSWAAPYHFLSMWGSVVVTETRHLSHWAELTVTGLGHGVWDLESGSGDSESTRIFRRYLNIFKKRFYNRSTCIYVSNAENTIIVHCWIGWFLPCSWCTMQLTLPFDKR